MKTRVAFVLLILFSAACQNSKVESPRDSAPSFTKRAWRPLNVVMITIDTLRADHLGCYGNSRIATPNLDNLAQRGILFENAVAQTPLTPPSHASMFTGKYPNVHGVRGTGGFVLDDSQLTLAEILRDKGWQTAAFVGAPVLKRLYGLNQGFQTYDDRMPEPDPAKTALENPSLRAGVVVDRAIQWLEGRSDGAPFFLWVHVYDPHAPYDPPEPFKKRYRDSPYDGEIAYVDQEVGRLLSTLERMSPPEKTVLTVLADHGEGLGEHGEFSHGVFLYDATLRIPWLLVAPGVPSGKRVQQQVRTIDLLPTLLSLVGGELPACQGVALTPAFSSSPVDLGSEVSYIETLYPKINMNWAELRGVRTAAWKYIRAPKPELYDLRRDPLEKDNVIAQHPEEVSGFERELNHLVPTGSGQSVEEVRVHNVNQETARQLRSLGYATGESSGKIQLTGQGVDPKDRIHILELIDEASTNLKEIPGASRIRLLEQAIKEDPANPLLYYFLGEAYEKTNRNAEALKLYQTGIDKKVTTGNRSFVRMALIYGRMGKVDEGILCFEKALDADPMDTETQNRLAVAYLMKGREVEAERLLKVVLVSDRDNAQALNSLGWLALRNRNTTAAHQYFERALMADPEFLEPYVNLGMLSKQSGDVKNARRYFEAYLAKATLEKYRETAARIRKELALLPKG